MANKVRYRNTILEALVRATNAYPGLTSTQLIIALYVAENPGINLVELCQLAGMAMPTVSKVARSLSVAGAEHALAPAYGLIEVRRNPVDGRGRVLTLSKAGREFCAVLDKLIEIATPIHGAQDLPKSANLNGTVSLSQPGEVRAVGRSL